MPDFATKSSQASQRSNGQSSASAGPQAASQPSPHAGVDQTGLDSHLKEEIEELKKRLANLQGVIDGTSRSDKVIGWLTASGGKTDHAKRKDEKRKLEKQLSSLTEIIETPIPQTSEEAVATAKWIDESENTLDQTTKRKYVDYYLWLADGLAGYWLPKDIDDFEFHGLESHREKLSKWKVSPSTPDVSRPSAEYKSKTNGVHVPTPRGESQSQLSSSDVFGVPERKLPEFYYKLNPQRDATEENSQAYQPLNLGLFDSAMTQMLESLTAQAEANPPTHQPSGSNPVSSTAANSLTHQPSDPNSVGSTQEKEKVSKENTLRAHAEAWKLVKSILKEEAERTSDNPSEEVIRTRNSCQWILRPDSPTKLYVVSSTHDKKGYFPHYDSDDSSLPDGHITDDKPVDDYDTDTWTNTGELKAEADGSNPADLAGEQGDGFIMLSVDTIYEKKDLRSYVLKTLRHEIQHTADYHDDLEPAQVADQAIGGADLEEDLKEYMTEYRAFSYERMRSKEDIKEKWDRTKKDDEYAKDGKHKGHPSPDQYTHQWYIFMRIMTRYSNLSERWKKDQQFRTKVLAYKNPDDRGMNKLNSPRIDNLIKTLQKGNHKGNDTETQKMLSALDEHDKKYIKDETQSSILRAYLSQKGVDLDHL